MEAIWYYEYTLDRDYLEKRLYPHLKLLDAFYRSYMTSDGTRYVIEHSSAHEASDDLNPALDLGYFRSIDQALLKFSDLLGVDAALRPVWQDVLAKLSPYPTGTYNGKTVYLIAENVNGSTDIANTFEPGNQPINLEGSVFPGEDIFLGGDESKLQITRDTLAAMNSWGLAGGSSNNGFPKEFPMAARVGYPADDLLAKFKAAIPKHWRATNLTYAQGGGGIETSGAIETLQSMLLQSEGGVVRVFPVWPKTSDAHFKRLRAKGAFVVSSSLAAGSVVSIDIESDAGAALTLENPWGAKLPQVLQISPGGGSAVAVTGQGSQLQFQTTAGALYRITP
jgi:hypothetical protein